MSGNKRSMITEGKKLMTNNIYNYLCSLKYLSFCANWGKQDLVVGREQNYKEEEKAGVRKGRLRDGKKRRN